MPQSEGGPNEAMPGAATRWEKVERLILDFGVLLLLLGMALMLFEAGGRALFGASRDWAQESVRFAVDWAFFLCLAISARRGFHIRTDMLLDRLSPAWRHACDMGAAVCGLAFAALLLYGGAIQERQLYRNGMVTESNLDIPMWTVQIVLPVGAALLAAFYVGALVRGARGRAPFVKSVDYE
jgi:C4-dicarboxylate transporter, DctQ subunit